MNLIVLALMGKLRRLRRTMMMKHLFTKEIICASIAGIAIGASTFAAVRLLCELLVLLSY